MSNPSIVNPNATTYLGIIGRNLLVYLCYNVVFHVWCSMYLNPENCGNPMSRQTSNRVSQIDEEGNVILLEQDIWALLQGRWQKGCRGAFAPINNYQRVHCTCPDKYSSFVGVALHRKMAKIMKICVCACWKVIFLREGVDSLPPWKCFAPVLWNSWLFP